MSADDVNSKVPIVVQFPYQGGVQESVLDYKVRVNKQAGTRVASWDLEKGTSSKSEEAEGFFYVQAPPNSTESVVGSEDTRVRVDHKHFAPGGKYRSIVKILVNYQKDSSKWMMGTGWLIRPDLLVTAGHCGYDKGHRLGCAKSVKCWIGYQGKNSVNDRNVQFRWGKKIATPSMWLSGTDRTYDVAFVHLEKPFDDIEPFQYRDTPLSGSGLLGVVGYPGDLPHAGAEKGAYMYEDWQQTKWKLTDTGNMLSYEIDTYGGNSGSPVLFNHTNVSIGVHTYGGNPNQATCIGSRGNMFEAYVANLFNPEQESVMDEVPAGDGFPQITFVKAPALSIRDTATESAGFEDGDDTEGFWDVLKDVGRTVLPVASTFAGFAGPLGPLVSVGLGAAQKLCESGFDGTEGTLEADSLDGVTERAILQEAAAQALLTHTAAIQREGLLPKMSAVYKNISPTVKNSLPQVAKTISPLAINLAVDALGKTDGNRQESSIASGDLPTFPKTRSAESTVTNPKIDAFVKQLKEAQDPDTDDTEGWFTDMVHKTVDIATSIGKPLMKIAPQGLNLLQKAFPKIAPAANVAKSVLSAISGSTESDIVGNAPNGVDLNYIAKKSLLGEAALQVFMDLPPATSARLAEEGFFDTIFSTITSIAPTVAKYAPDVINTVAGVIKSVTESELEQPSRRPAEELNSKPVRGKSLNSKPSRSRLNAKPFDFDSLGQDPAR